MSQDKPSPEPMGSGGPGICVCNEYECCDVCMVNQCKPRRYPTPEPDAQPERDGVTRGPKPASPLPWRSDTCRDYADEYVAFIEDANGNHPDIDDEQECAAIVHRVNNWDALIAERDAAIARAERAEALLAEADDIVVRLVQHGPMGKVMNEAVRCIARHAERSKTDE